MDKYGNIYEAEAMRKQLQDAAEDETIDQAIREDEARLAGYLKGMAEAKRAETEQLFRERLREPFKKGASGP